MYTFVYNTHTVIVRGTLPRRLVQYRRLCYPTPYTIDTPIGIVATHASQDLCAHITV